MDPSGKTTPRVSAGNPRLSPTSYPWNVTAGREEKDTPKGRGWDPGPREPSRVMLDSQNSQKTPTECLQVTFSISDQGSPPLSSAGPAPAAGWEFSSWDPTGIWDGFSDGFRSWVCVLLHTWGANGHHKTLSPLTMQLL